MAKNVFRKHTENTSTQTSAEDVQDDPSDKKVKKNIFDFFKDPRLHLIFGLFFIFSSVFITFSLISYLFTGNADQSVVEALFTTSATESGRETENWLGLVGAIVSHYLIFKGFGIASLFFMPLLFVYGVKIVFQKEIYPARKLLNHTLFLATWVSMVFGYLTFLTAQEQAIGFLGGGIGYELSILVDNYLGIGTFLMLGFAFIVYLIFSLDITTLATKKTKIKPEEEDKKTLFDIHGDDTDDSTDEQSEQLIVDNNIPKNVEEWSILPKPANITSPDNLELTIENENRINERPSPFSEPEPSKPELEKSFESVTADLEPYDPKLDLSGYKYPEISLLKDYGEQKNYVVTKDELEENKNNIVKTLSDFSIGITSIKATIGPTVTLYEIVPDAGIKISKIANLSDDIALRLSALGVRIIAPMPGKGTIGIEVPNKNKQMVSAREALMDERFTNNKMELPIVFGKTISNDVFIEDLAKMPHLLMAGATGMGKSVGINMLLTSLLFKKHPSELKIVMVDPKKVELSLYNKIERHFLAKLPDSEEAILTDTKKVIHTLNSLCIEMDTRYSLLKDAGCRNLKEYNPKFVSRRLNPEEGHRFLPYIVVVIDELADLMITAGKEIETPIARLAQLARAVGIHLVLATQRPSVAVITGLIKANFPARLSFRVTSKIDSKIILDEGGADQLIGKGDMLLKLNADTIRLQCAFVDTPEVEALADFIGHQRGYSTAYQLPEFFDENADPTVKDVDLANRDPKFEEAAKLVVAFQQGSTSLIQRKLSLGFARSGRIMDQLEAAGVVGPPNGSKVREVMVRDENSLNDLLAGI
ncbi:MAG: DNA translocase FtsK 4TM domain-containing protein [Cytophagales bacterium]|nr:DNA translocase FtsK 4TM domain-containing protein [Cytophagales bacterium]